MEFKTPNQPLAMPNWELAGSVLLSWWGILFGIFLRIKPSGEVESLEL